MEIQFEIDVPKIILPALSQSRHFSARMQIIPKELGNPGYGVFIGCDLMKELDMDTSLQDDTITWGELSINMVLKDHWTKDRMATCVSKLSRREKDEETQVHEGTNRNEDPIRNENEAVGMVGEAYVTDALKAAE